MLNWQAAQADDFEALHQLRLAAMRPSLEAVGRYDPPRSRQRFASRFVAQDTRWILLAGERVGFAAMRVAEGYCQLEHLYVHPQAQGRGAGSWALHALQQEARLLGLGIRLAALRDSPANHFYQHLGFVRSHEEEWDIYYLWQP
ncbi:GNAT family N-acetyltransferase [Vogesella sp. LIG4]|uniref:GNAT family N-acetyltransferase n=1 Tax=Vogesella sp. LIG4 TaxID=1192162 RepID=UPI00081FD1F4|nr:GNAT family N-acetyltransferase [Vogesella sp. LIG4]SCK25063.1 Predicted acetyltransferase [Vogesella sp. LIG4]